MLQNASLLAVEFQTVLVSRYFIVSSELSVCVQPCCTLWLQRERAFGTHKGQTVSKICLICVFKPVILPEVLCGCQAWFFTLREERKLMLFENKGTDEDI